MKLEQLKEEVQKYQYMEDTKIIDVSLAAIIATRLKIGDPVWLVIIGPSSGGKSQILRPLALTDPKFLHRVDDLTENTFLSGMKVKKDETSPSLLHRIGAKGMIVVSDLTVIFSKNKESRATILSQFRMLYDGEMTKFSGNNAEPLTWKGYVGVVAGSTPSIYSHFEEVSDMGERFLYYRMKEYDGYKATKLSLNRSLFGKALDEKLAELYDEYVKGVVKSVVDGDNDVDNLVIEADVQERIIRIATLAESIRCVSHTDWDRTIDRIPVPAMPMRVALQLTAIAKALMVMRKSEGGGGQLTESDLDSIDWCGYSLANEEKRACLRVLGFFDYEISASTQTIADQVGLSSEVIGNVLQNMAATGVLVRSGGASGLVWRIKNKTDWEIVRRVENIKESNLLKEREMSDEDGEAKDDAVKHAFDRF